MKMFTALVPRLLIVARYVLLAGVIGFAVYYLAVQWTGVTKALETISWLSLIASFVMVLLGLAAGTLSWVSILNGLGPKVPIPRASQVMLVGQLGKYVPGSVWAYVMQMELGRQYGVLRPRVLVTALYAAGIGVVSSLILGAFALPVLIQGNTQLLWLFLLLPIGLACLHPAIMTWLASLMLRVFRRPPLEQRVTFGVIRRAVGWSLASYVFYGLHLWILVHSLAKPNFFTLVLLTGAVAMGFTVGLFAFVFPSGVGVREAVLIGAMSLLLTTSQGTAISLVSRILFTTADVLAAGIAVLFVIILRRKLRVETVSQYADVAVDHGSKRSSE